MNSVEGWRRVWRTAVTGDRYFDWVREQEGGEPPKIDERPPVFPPGIKEGSLTKEPPQSNSGEQQVYGRPRSGNTQAGISGQVLSDKQDEAMGFTGRKRRG